MTSDRYEQLTPPQVATTLRSLPRRHREALSLAPPDVDAAALAAAPAPDGRSVAELLEATVGALRSLQTALERTVHSDGATLDAALIAPEGATAATGIRPRALDLEALDAAAGELADTISRVPSAFWLHHATVTAGLEGAPRTVTAETIARHAARVGVENLRLIERAVRDLARRHGVDADEVDAAEQDQP